MSYHVEKRSTTPAIDAIVSNVRRLSSIDRLPCPGCKGQMWKVDNGDYPYETYSKGGRFYRTERFYCDDCGTFADVKQEYTPVQRTVSVYQDVHDD